MNPPSTIKKETKNTNNIKKKRYISILVVTFIYTTINIIVSTNFLIRIISFSLYHPPAHTFIFILFIADCFSAFKYTIYFCLQQQFLSFIYKIWEICMLMPLSFSLLPCPSFITSIMSTLQNYQTYILFSNSHFLLCFSSTA